MRHPIYEASMQNRKENMEKYENAMNSSDLPEEDRADFMALNLGLVGEYGDLIAARMGGNGEVNADHIPPINSYEQAFAIVQEDPEFRRTHPTLYEKLKKSQSNDPGYYLLCMEVRAEHHTQALTTGHTNEARVCRKLMAEALSRGDMEKTLKIAFITANPETSQKLKNNPPPNGLSADYYQVGYRLLIDKYSVKRLIDSNEQLCLHKWVHEKKYLEEDTDEYNSIREAIFARNQL